ARAYAGAWASVLPSVDEAFGLVLIESLAAGTPAVAARSGACPEIIDDDRVGRLFAPDDADDLLRAMEEALDLGSEAETSAPSRSGSPGGTRIALRRSTYPSRPRTAVAITGVPQSTTAIRRTCPALGPPSLRQRT